MGQRVKHGLHACGSHCEESGLVRVEAGHHLRFSHKSSSCSSLELPGFYRGGERDRHPEVTFSWLVSLWEADSCKPLIWERKNVREEQEEETKYLQVVKS